MKFRGIFRFELAYQLRRPWPWLAMAVVGLFAYLVTGVGMVPVTLPQEFILNSPFLITVVSVLACQIWLLVAPPVAGEAAARDVHTGLHPLMYTSSLSKAEYLGGRFAAAFVLNALIMLAVQAGNLLAVYASDVPPEIIGPFRPEAYLAAWVYIGLSNAFIGTAVQFGAALLSGRPMASYVGSFALFFLSYPVTLFLYVGLSGRAAIAGLTDPIGVFAIMNELMSQWTLIEKNVRMFTLEGEMVVNRLLWLGFAVLTFAFSCRRFRFAHPTVTDISPLRWFRRRRPPAAAEPVTVPAPAAVAVPVPARSFGVATQVSQMLAVARSSFAMIARSPAGIFMLMLFPVLLVLMLQVEMQYWSVPIEPRTVQIVTRYLTGPITNPINYWLIVPLLIVHLAGELIFRERDAQLDESVDASPVPEWVLFAGKYAGLALVLVAFMALLMGVGIVTQLLEGYHDFELGKYVLMLFGFQLPEYLLFAMLAFAVQTAVNHKYVGPIVALFAYLMMIFPGFFGIEHNLFVYSAGPGWAVTDMRGVAGTLGPWLWFQLYWAVWAVLLAILALLLWVRGRESRFVARLRSARERFTRGVARTAAVAFVLVLALGGFIFYNTNVLNEFVTGDELVDRAARYEQRYGMYEGKPQPQRTAARLHVDLRPGERTATIRGSYRLVNRSDVPIDSLHIEPAELATRLSLDRPSRVVLADDELGHHIHALDEPLQPGDSMTLEFEVRFERRGFTHGGLRTNGAGPAIMANGTFLTSSALPVIGYRAERELWDPEDRRRYGLPRQVTLPPPSDIDAGLAADPGATFDAVIVTDEDQVAVAPGELRGTWTEAGRRYFHYASDVPIGGLFIFASADYEVIREQHNGVDVQLYVHREHTKHAHRLLRSLKASLAYNSTHFGSYPLRFLQLIEQPGIFFGMGVDGSGVITAGENIFALDPKDDGFDVLFETAAHEVGHQWWGMQLRPAFAEGGGIISESLAWYSAMRLVRAEKGREALRRFMSFMRQPNPWPQIRTGLPLLRALDPWANYRKGPYAMNALAEYVGEDRINAALRRLIEQSRSSLATSLDMYRELQAVTPDSLKPLLRGLFEVNAFWTFDTNRATAVQTDDGVWEVTFEVEARKIVVDSTGHETEVPMTEPVEIGVFAAAGPGEWLGRPLYVGMHKIRSGTQTLTVTVPERPDRGGIDPYNLLDWEEGDNIETIEVSGSADGLRVSSSEGPFRGRVQGKGIGKRQGSAVPVPSGL